MNLIRLRFLNFKISSKLRAFECKRQIFSPSSLGLVEFQEYRKRSRQSIANIDVLRNRLKKLCANENNMIFLDDLQKMVIIAENEADIYLISKALKIYNSQKTVIFNECIIGTQVMRLLHVMGQPMEAVSLVTDENMFVYFNNLRSHLLLLDMLFKNKEYEEVIRMFEYYQTKLLLENPASLVYDVFFAACYKLNTPESLDKALSLQKDNYRAKRKLHSRSKLFIAALALNQGQTLYAVETINDIHSNSLAENIRFKAYAKAKRFEDIFQSIRDFLENPKLFDFFILESTLNFIEEEAQNFSANVTPELQKLKKELLIHNCYKDETLDKHLCAETNVKLNKPKNFKKGTRPSKENTVGNDLKFDVNHVHVAS